jgi:hypothetical protein
MGLTIHYALGMPARTKPETVRARLESLRQYALTLGLAEVSEIREFVGQKACHFEFYRHLKGPDRDWFWFLIQAMRHVPDPRNRPSGNHSITYDAIPERVIGFRTQPGAGCEPANFGLVRLPATVVVPGLAPISCPSGWHWGSFCKTQDAGSPEYGGVANFLRCHLTVVALLDEAKRLKLLRHVSDEGDYWEKRDIEALVREVGEWDEMIAATVGQLKDQFGPALVAPILQRQDFEHLEARGRASEGDDA